MKAQEVKKLVARTRRGDADAYREIVETYKERLYAFLWKMVRNHHEAEELTQAAFVKAFESLDSYSTKYAFSTWLYTIGYRLCLNKLRKRKPVSADIDFEAVGEEREDVAITLANSESAQKLKSEVWDAVDQLSEIQKAAVLLFYQESQSCQDISKVLGIPAVTVKSHLHRARAKLRDLIDPEVAETHGTIPFPKQASA